MVMGIVENNLASLISFWKMFTRTSVTNEEEWHRFELEIRTKSDNIHHQI